MSSNLLEKAISIATEAHKGQTDKSGSPYILHLVRVMLKGKNTDEMICGVLHDLIEDTSWTFERLKEEGFPEYIVEVLKCVTKKQKEDYSSFINRISQNKLAARIKLYDLEDNMDISRLTNISEEDTERLKKYLLAYNYLKAY